MIGAAVTIEGLTKTFDRFTAVRDLSIEVRAGEFLSVLGASGSGKSTVLRMIAGLVEPSAGRIVIDGRDATRLPPEARGVGMVFQDYALFPHMSVRQNIAFPLRMRRTPRAMLARKVAQTIDLVGIEGLAERRPAQLSGGQQQRVALARALVFEPKLLLLDEPLSALDKGLRDYMKAELKTLHRRVGVTVVYVTHDQSEALAMSDRVAVMHHGNLLDVDTPARLYDLPGSRYIAGFVGDANLIEGEIVWTDPDWATISCALGAWRLAPDRVRMDAGSGAGRARSNGPATIVIRPEDVAVAAADAPASAGIALPCEVLEALYNGSYTLYALRCQAGVTLSARAPGQGDARLAPGSRATASLSVGRSVVVEPGSA